MAAIDLTAATFDAAIDKPGITLIDWWAPWCGPCKTFKPIFEAAATRHPDLTFGKVNTDAEQRLGAEFQIRSIPTLMVFRDGILVFAQPGMLPPQALDQLIGKVRELDMDDVRKQIAAEKAKQKPQSAMRP